MASNSHIDKEIIKVLGYFDYFKFPLKLEEIHHFIGVKIDVSDLNTHLLNLVSKNKIIKIEDCFLISDLPELVERKKQGFAKAKKRMKRAKSIARLINWFPYVRMVAISGSLSKGYADEKSDIDFFIITTNDNLWTSRTLLHILKKLSFLVNMQHSFCMNYFLAENHLELEEKNYFTAIELSTLIPQKGTYYYNELMKSNNWIKDYLPNFENKTAIEGIKQPRGIKWLFERMFGFGNLNKFTMSLTDKRWRKKWKEKGFPEEEYDLAFKTTLYESKNHPGNYQKKVLNHIEEIKKDKP